MNEKNNLVMTMNGIEYNLGCTLRVAYIVQSYNSHRPYTEVFSEISEMPIEKQIEILYASFTAANKEIADTIPKKAFTDYVLDHYTLEDLMDHIKAIITGITGIDLDEDKETEGTSNNVNEQGN